MRALTAFLCALLVCLGCTCSTPSGSLAASRLRADPLIGSYRNPLPILLPDGSRMESCPDPWVLQSRTPGDSGWYLYCTGEKFHDGGASHRMAISRSEDLVHWTYVGDVFPEPPAGIDPEAGLWAPDVVFYHGRYFLYFTVSRSSPSGGSEIRVATASGPAGPWQLRAAPVVEAEAALCCGGQPRWTLDPEVVEDGQHRYLFFGSYYGGVFARELTSDGLATIPSSEVQIAVDSRYEAPNVVKRDGYFYLLLSAGDCCNGALSGYGMFAARSRSALGPYVDRDGNTLLEARVGGTPVLATNGNQWVGPGHNALVTGADGQDWLVYHAVSADNPLFADGETRRPVLMDRLDWIDGWPLVRGGLGASVDVQPAPATASLASLPSPSLPFPPKAQKPDAPGALLSSFSDEFAGPGVGRQWSWQASASAPAWSFHGSGFSFATQPGEMYEGSKVAMLTEDAPAGDFLIEVSLRSDLPSQGEVGAVQGGLLLYKDRDNYVKLVSGAIRSTRQIQFAKQVREAKGPRLSGQTLLSAPGDTTWLRLVRRTVEGRELYTAYSSQDGENWERGGTWSHALGARPRIGLVSMGGAGFHTTFQYVRAYSIAN